MENNANSNPTPEQVRLIYKEVYNLYLKWKDIKNDDDWTVLVAESHEINLKYEFPLCKNMLVDVLRVVEYEYMNRGKKG